MTTAAGITIDGATLRRAAVDAVRKLDPRMMVRSPVMFTVEVGAALISLLAVVRLGAEEAVAESPAFTAAIALGLWATVLFATFAEALAERRGRAHADAMRSTRSDTPARRLAAPSRTAATTTVASPLLRKGDHVLVEAGETIPGDGEVVEGVASVDESAITGESAPVIRESGGDRSAVTGGTRVLSDWIVVRITADPGESFLDRMIGLVEGARRRKTPNEIALDILLAGLTFVFLVVTATLLPFSMEAVRASGRGEPLGLAVLAALFVCLAPTTIGGLLPAIGIAGIDRMVRANVLASSGRAIEAAGDVDVLLLDKTGTITLGNRQAAAFRPADGVTIAELAESARLASLADETPEGRSIVVLARSHRADGVSDGVPDGATFVPFTAETRMSGVDLDGRRIRKGARDAIAKGVAAGGGRLPDGVEQACTEVARAGATPLVVVDGERVLGVVELRDIVKGGLRERFSELRRMGIRTVMITGDNPLTAAAIAAEAGVDDFLAEATPEAKLAMIRRCQAEGHLVAMTGDGTNDAPALAQADVAVAMQSGTQAAKEAGNMVDLDSDPTKLLEIVAVGKQLLMTRGSLTTFSLANDLSKYFAIVPAAFAGIWPQLSALNVMRLHSPTSAVLAAVAFNALVIVALVPLALRGVRYRPLPAAELLRRNLLVWGVGGLLLPFPCIKVLDSLLASWGIG